MRSLIAFFFLGHRGALSEEEALQENRRPDDDDRHARLNRRRLSRFGWQFAATAPPERGQAVLDDCTPSLSGANMLDEQERPVAGERRHRGHESARTDLLMGRPSPVRGGNPVTVVRQVLPSSWPTRTPPRAPASGWRRPRQRPQGPRPAARAYDGPLRSGVAHTAPVTRPLPRGRPGSSS